MDDWRRTLLIAVQQVFSKELGHLYAEKVLLGALLPCGGVEQWNDMIKFDEKLQVDFFIPFVWSPFVKIKKRVLFLLKANEKAALRAEESWQNLFIMSGN